MGSVLSRGQALAEEERERKEGRKRGREEGREDGVLKIEK